MVKVTFKKAINIEQHGLIQTCLFIFCNRVIELGEKWTAIVFEENVDCPFVYSSNIKSIEKVKPTDL